MLYGVIARFESAKSKLYNLIYSDKLYNMDFDKYKNVLEYVPDVKLKIHEQNIMDDEIMGVIAEF